MINRHYILHYIKSLKLKDFIEFQYYFFNINSKLIKITLFKENGLFSFYVNIDEVLRFIRITNEYK